MTFKPQKQPSAAVRTLLFGLGIMLSSTVFAAKPVKTVEPAYATQADFIAAITDLQSQIDAEAAARIAADEDFQNQIDAEVAAREAEDANLQSQIDAESAARLAADVDFQRQIDDETAARIAANADLQSQIDAIDSQPPPSTPYLVGDTGPAGGIVFYVTDNGLHGLEVKPLEWDFMGYPLNQQTSTWGCMGTEVIGADGIDIGTGRQNTADIVASCDDETGTIGDTSARGDEVFFEFNGFNDWFVPSKDELDEILQRGVLTLDNSGIHFWSSTESDNDSAWIVHAFNQVDGYGQVVGVEKQWYPEGKTYSGVLQLVRAF